MGAGDDSTEAAGHAGWCADTDFSNRLSPTELPGHPLPKARLRALEQSLQEGKEACTALVRIGTDHSNGGRLADPEEHSGIRILRIPAFPHSVAQGEHATSSEFGLTELQDADIRLFCAGDMVAFAGAKPPDAVAVGTHSDRESD